MSDGPFRNLKLGKRWRRFIEAAENDAFDSAECNALASDALVDEILTSNEALLINLRSYASRNQLEFDPLSSVECIFNDHMKTSFADRLQKELVFRMSQQVSPVDALWQALDASVCNQASQVKKRIANECILERESEKMRQDQFDRALKRANATLDGLYRNDICVALLAGDKNAFKETVSKKIGIDEGPRL